MGAAAIKKTAIIINQLTTPPRKTKKAAGGAWCSSGGLRLIWSAAQTCRRAGLRFPGESNFLSSYLRQDREPILDAEPLDVAVAQLTAEADEFPPRVRQRRLGATWVRPG